MTFPDPVISVAIEPKTKGDQDKLGNGALAASPRRIRPSRVHGDEETGQTIIAGMGELHLEVIVDRLLREFKVDANVGKSAGRLPRDHQEAGLEGRRDSSSARPVVPVCSPSVVIDLEPLRPGSGFEFEDKVKGGGRPA